MLLSPLSLTSPMSTGGGTVPTDSISAEKLLVLLGFSDYQTHDTYIEQRAKRTLKPEQASRCLEIVAELARLDTAISEAVMDSLVDKTCETETNWNRHLKTLRGQAHQLLKELARLYDLYVNYSKYTGKSYSSGRAGVTTHYQ